jgi:hypothetical protein
VYDYAMPPSPADVIDASLAAYNARDVDGFARWFAEDAEVFDQAGSTPHVPVMRGLAEIRAAYAALFAASPSLHSRIVQRIAVGDLVVDHEHVRGRAGGDVEIVITYQVRDGAIRRVWFSRTPLAAPPPPS